MSDSNGVEAGLFDQYVDIDMFTHTDWDAWLVDCSEESGHNQVFFSNGTG